MKNEIDINLPVEDIEKVLFLRDFLNFLKFLLKEKAELTNTGNLNLKTIEKISGFIPNPHKVELGFVIRSEAEWPYLEEIDILSKIMKVTAKRKKQRYLSKYGRHFLTKSLTAQYAELFLIYWKRLNWMYIFPFGPDDNSNPACRLQDEQDFAVKEMLNFKREKDEWINFLEFAEHLRNKLNLKLFNYLGEDLPERVHDCIKAVLLKHFEMFGILEFKYGKEKIEHYEFETIVSFRLTRLGSNLLKNIISANRLEPVFDVFSNLN